MDLKLSKIYKSIVDRYDIIFNESIEAIDILNANYINSIFNIIEFWANSESLNDESINKFQIKEESYNGKKSINRKSTKIKKLFPILDSEIKHFHSTDFHGDLNALMYFLLKSGVVRFKTNENHIIFYNLKSNEIVDLKKIQILPKETIANCFPIPNIEINPLFSGSLTLGGDFIDRGKFSIPTLLTVIHILKINKFLSKPKNIVACVGNHEYDLIQNIDNITGISKMICNELLKAINDDLFVFCKYIGDNIIISHSALIGDLEKIIKVYQKKENKQFFKDTISNITLEGILKCDSINSLSDFLNYGFKKIVLEKEKIQLCDVCIYDIKSEAMPVLKFGLDKLKFRNIIGHQIDNIENSFRIPIMFDDISCFGKFLITDACQCVSERENVARNPDLTPARFLTILYNSVKCFGFDISNNYIQKVGFDNINKQVLKTSKLSLME